MMTFSATTIIYDPNPMYKTYMWMITQLAWNQSPFGIKEIGWVNDIFGLISNIPATIVSVLTIHHVYKTSKVPGSSERSGKRLRSVIKVALLSAGSMLAMSLGTSRVLIKKKDSERAFLYLLFHIILMNYLPIVMSSYNSVVYVLCSYGSIFHGARDG